MKVKKKRVWEVDFLRGFCIILMVFDHTMFDFLMLPYWTKNFWQISNGFFRFMSNFAYSRYWEETWRIGSRIVVVSIFLLLSGISGAFSKNNGMRALKLCAAAVGLSCATVFIDSVANLGVSILFGVLHCLAVSVLLYAAIRAVAGRYSRYFFAAFGILIILYGLSIDYYWIPELTRYPQSISDALSLLLGTKYYGADAFGIFPYTGIFFMGAAIGESVYRDGVSLLPRLDRAWNKPLCAVGRHTIWIYLAHQPVILGLIAGAAMLFGYRFF